jgi:hypothetical protein
MEDSQNVTPSNSRGGRRRSIRSVVCASNLNVPLQTAWSLPPSGFGRTVPGPPTRRRVKSCDMADVFPNDADGDALCNVAAGGTDMSRPMVIDYAVGAPDQATALVIAEVVAPRGYDPSISEDQDGGTWIV